MHKYIFILFSFFGSSILITSMDCSQSPVETIKSPQTPPPAPHSKHRRLSEEIIGEAVQMHALSPISLVVDARTGQESYYGSTPLLAQNYVTPSTAGKKYHRRILSAQETESMQRVIGPSTLELFQSVSTHSEEQKRKAELQGISRPSIVKETRKRGLSDVEIRVLKKRFGQKGVQYALKSIASAQRKKNVELMGIMPAPKVQTYVKQEHNNPKTPGAQDCCAIQ